MASTIKVNNIQNQCGANIVNKCSTTITLGASGDNITLAAGATQSGFGRTGTVNWDTTAKTASFTAVSGNGYFVNTTSGAITVTLPATPSAGDIVAIADYANTWQTNNVTVARNGSLINGEAFDYIASTEGISLTFVYVDGTRGWKNVNDGTTNATGASPFIIATGGTITTCGDYKIHTFTAPGTFCVSNAGLPSGSNTVDYLVVAGGGSGGARSPGNGNGGGGAGGFRASSATYTVGCAPGSPLVSCVSALPVSVTGYPITVGAGASPVGPSPSGVCGQQGSNSVFSTITSTGGGGGGSGQSLQPGLPGGSGGGAGGGAPGGNSGGSGNTPPVSPPQGQPGGNSESGGTPDAFAAGGGGAISAGANAAPGPTAANGGAGAGLPSAFGTSGENCGSYYYFSGGGGAGSVPGQNCNGAGGLGGGGNGGGGAAPGNGVAGTANTGGAGGASSGETGCFVSGAGGSGIVIIRYKYQ